MLIKSLNRTFSDRKQIEEALRESALREQAVAHVLQKMRQTLDIDTIFSATTEELRGVLNCDLRFAAALRYRVAIYRFNPAISSPSINS
jgi:two-component system sensor histidine kinase/response regulator